MEQKQTVTQIFESIASRICDHYCKYPEASLSMFKDPDDAHTFMLNNVCCNCPLQEL